jgi:hypothetical protein
MAYIVVKTRKYFNRASILSFSIAKRVWEYQCMKNIGFYMSTYLIDVVFVSNRFPSFNWAWSPDQIPIHVYCFQLWKVICKEYLCDICDYFLAPLHKAIFDFHPHRISPGAIKSIQGI